MEKNNPLHYIFFLCLFFCAGLLQVSGQNKPMDSISIRQNYALPSPIHYESYYDVSAEMYYLYPKVGNTIVGDPIAMTPAEYHQYVMQNALSSYYREKSANNNLGSLKERTDAAKKGFIPSINIKNKLFESIFGGNKIEIIPQGFASFDLGGLYQKIDNPLILPQNRTNFAFNIQQRIQLGLLGKVGENLQLKANYDTQSGFAFENRMNLTWQAKGTWKDLQNKGIDQSKGGEDKIIKRIEFGNVNMPLSTSLIRGSESLFGLKTEFQLGKTTGTFVFSQQQGEARSIVAQGGGVMSTFKINAFDYEDNQHYYLGQYFLDNYDRSLLTYPSIQSKISITRIEAWVLDQGSANLQDQKGILGIRDLGEGPSIYPDNSQNNLYQRIAGLGAPLRDPTTTYNTIIGQSFPNAQGVQETYQDGEHFIFNRKARRLSATEYHYDPQLGYLSLNQRLNDNQLLAVAYSYTVGGTTEVHKVGEFSEDSPVLMLKLLKPNISVKTSSPMWNLMMKNIYSLNTMQISAENFMLNVLYRDPNTGGKVNYLPTEVPGFADTNMLKIFNWDRLNMNNDLQTNGTVSGDGIFDFVPGITVDAENGKIIFTKAKPFGSYLQNLLGSNDTNYVYNDLYDQQKQVASQSNLAQRYTLEGRYKGSQGSGISLDAINVPQGSVKVTANGVALTEGIDYTVDYMLGTVTIINESIKQSGQAINISLENQLTFNTQRKRFLGLNLERKFNEHLTLGATVVNYGETPLTQKVNYGQEAVNNTMAGFNILYNNEMPFLTRLNDKIPLINTEAPSNLNFMAEGAYLIPGQNNGMDNQSYIDDFEQTTSKISLKEPVLWSLASKPERNQNDPIFQGAGTTNDLTEGNGRGLISWYNIDPRFYGVGGNAPNGINAQAVSNHASRRVATSELYNSRDFVAGEQLYTNTFDVTFYPSQRGPYNVNPQEESTQERWGGLMRSVSVSNFTNSNIEYVEFWMMDPRADGNPLGSDPKLLLHLGNVSEDILKDGKLQYENGLSSPSTPASTTSSVWGVQPTQFPILYAFSSEGEDRVAQDAGFDGLNNEAESAAFNIAPVNPVTNVTDPASDDFVFYLSDQFRGEMASSLTERYKYFRNPEGNSQSNTLEVASQTPDAEDVNHDYNLDQSENYNQYTISLAADQMVLGQNHIVDVKEVPVRFDNGQQSTNKWYLFRIPVGSYDDANIGGDADASILNNVRFARMIMQGFDQTSTLRFGTLDLVRSDWRKYTKNIATNPTDDEGTILQPQDEIDNFFVGSVNLEENGLNQPPYVLPPGIDRQVLSGNAGTQRQNEASLYMKVQNLNNSPKGVFKNTALDMRRYKKMKLFVHAEDARNPSSSQLDENAKFFIRFGSDATDNYYEYEASLKYTASNAVSPLEIWPDENTMDLEIQNFVDAKLKRDLESPNTMTQRFRYLDFGDDNKKIYVKGRPSLGSITTILIGVRNTPNAKGNRKAADPKDIILWVNELRLAEIENEGGYAGNATLNFNLGDFATVNASASYSSVGFGSITQRPSERSQAANSAFGVNANVNADKFIPEKVGLKIPVNYTYNQTIEDPKYNPIDNDVEFSKSPNKEQLKKVARTYTQQRSIGVVNMRKERMNATKKPKFYDVENLSVTTIYNDDFYRDVYTKRNYRQYLRGYVDYNYSFKPFVLRPFNKMISDTAKSYKYLRWIKEINFNPIPTRVSFRTELDRNYNELEFRNIDAILNNNTNAQSFAAIKNRNFYFGWQYGIGFNFTKSLKLEINSATRTLNDQGDVYGMNNSSIFNSPFRAGRPVLYNHRVQLNYRLPFEYLPYLDFMNLEVGYGFTYNWNARSTAINNFINPDTGELERLGNIGQNTNNIVGTGTVDVPKFFSKFKYFQNINTKLQKRRQEIDSLNNVYTQIWQKKNKKKTFKNYKFKNKLTPLQSIAFALTSMKQLDVSYTENNGTVLPGLLSAPNWYGYGQTLGGPNFAFLLGSQADYRRTVIENGWISGSEYMTDAYTQMKNQNLTANLQVMPINDFRIDLNILKNYNRNFSQSGYNIDVNPNNSGHDFTFATDLITYSKTVWSFKTAFTDGKTIYENMMANTLAISQKIGGSFLNEDGYAPGYGRENAYVLVPAFEAAIEGKTPNTMRDPKKAGVPLPNWRVTYSGLRNLPIVNNFFSKFDVLHAYTSTYTASGIQSSVDYYNAITNGADRFDTFNNFYNPYTFSQVGYVETFSPLVGVDFTMRNNFQFRAQYNRDRAFILGLVNHTLTEDSGNEYIVGMGYILKDLPMKVSYKGKTRTVKSDLNIRGDFSMRDSQTRITNILMNDSQVTGGQRMMSVKVSADYNISENFNLRFFYDQLMTKYKISTAFPLSTIRAGLTATFTFSGNN